MEWDYTSAAANWDPQVDIAKSPLMPYIGNSFAVWKCPADDSKAAVGPRVRSVSFNGVLMAIPVNVSVPSYPPGRQYQSAVRKISELRNPAEVFASLDEEEEARFDERFSDIIGA